MKNFIKQCTSVGILTAIALSAISCKTSRFVYYNFANITDYKIFPYRTAHKDSVTFNYAAALKPRTPKTITQNGKETAFAEYLSTNKTVAFLIIRNDTIQYENYFNGYNQSSVIASFSMAKSVTSILIGCALDDHLIQSVEEQVIKYVPELKGRGLDEVTIKDLLQMTSGIKFSESYTNPFGDAATFYYGRNLRKSLYKREPQYAPGTQFSYSSGDSQMLGLVLERALKGKTITAYLEEKLWKPLGMEYDATWSLDKKDDGLEKTFCCINARARDFAKIGRLYLNKGNWNGRQIVSEEWVETSTKADTTDGGDPSYKYQWWLEPNGNYMAQGILGQYVFVCPSKNLVIVRMGKADGQANWEGLFATLAQNY